MKRWRPFIYGLAASLLMSAYLIHAVKADSEQRQQRIEQEQQQLHDDIVFECRLAFPLNYISRDKCYARLLS